MNRLSVTTRKMTLHISQQQRQPLVVCRQQHRTTTTTTTKMTPSFATTSTAASSHKSLLQATMGNVNAKQYEYLLDEDEDENVNVNVNVNETETETETESNKNHQQDLVPRTLDDDTTSTSTTTTTHATAAVAPLTQWALEKCQELEERYDQIMSHIVSPLQQQVVELKRVCKEQQEQLNHVQYERDVDRKNWEQTLQLQEEETKQIIAELMNFNNKNTTNEESLVLVTPDKLCAIQQPEEVSTGVVLQAGIDLAESLIQFMLQDTDDSEVSVLERMEALNHLLVEEDKDEDEGNHKLQPQQPLLRIMNKDSKSRSNSDNNVADHLYQRIQELEQERDEFLQESLDMIQATKAACEIELQVKLAEIQEQADRTIQVRVMEELQKQRTIHVVKEEEGSAT